LAYYVKNAIETMDNKRFARVLRIMLALQSGQAYSTGDLAQITGVSRRTVFRDLQDLQNAGIPCHYLGRRRRYAIDPSFCLAPTNLNTKEALGLLLLTRKMSQHLEHPLSESIMHAALKIGNTLPGEMKEFCNKALSAVTVKPAPQWDAFSLDRYFNQLLNAILGSQVVSLSYFYTDQQAIRTIEFNPYHLIYSEYGWHVLGRTESVRGVASLQLSQIRGLRKTNRLFVREDEFDVHEYLGRAWSMKREGTLHHVKLRFLPHVAESVAKTQWHSTQTVDFQDDGSVIIRFHVDGLTEIVWWVLSYGDKVQVIAPRALRNKVIQIAKKTINANKQPLVT